MGIRVGHGFDIHRTVENRPLILAGVEVESLFGLQGHSDADVVLHALVDAILGALARGDIGEYFLDNDPQYKDANSELFVEGALEVLKEEGYSIGNVDATIVAQKPKLVAYKPLMKTRLARLLGVEENRINIKAKTHEEVGPLGQGEAIEAHVVVLLETA